MTASFARARPTTYPGQGTTAAGVVAVSSVSSSITASITGSVTTSFSSYTPTVSTALSTTSFTITSSAATLGGWFIYNPNSAVAYVQLFDTATVTVGTTAPTIVLGIPATAGANLQPFITFSTAIKAAATTTPTGSASLTSAVVASFWYG